MTKTLLILLTLSVTHFSLAAEPEPAPDPATAAEAPVEIVSAEFGLFDASDPKAPTFEPGLIVPHKEGQRYGWTIEVRTAKRSLSVREEYVFPNTPKAAKEQDALSESLSIATPKRNQVSQRQLVPLDGKIFGEWAMGSREPAGHRVLQVVIENQIAASFEFDVR